MHAVDVNVLMYARFDAQASHESAYQLLTDLRVDPAGLALFPAVINGFLRLATDFRVITEPLSAQIAMDYIDELLASPTVRTNGTMISTFVRPISLRTRFRARHSSSKQSRKFSLM